jgi:hypothetical protein
MGAGLSEKIVIWWGERPHVHSAIHFGWRSALGDVEPQQGFRPGVDQRYRRCDTVAGAGAAMTYRPFGLLLGCNA